MLRQRRNTDFEQGVVYLEAGDLVESNLRNFLLRLTTARAFKDYFKFAIYCILLAVPLYAVTISAMNHDWVMMVIDALIVPVGFVHGLLLLFGYVG